MRETEGNSEGDFVLGTSMQDALMLLVSKYDEGYVENALDGEVHIEIFEEDIEITPSALESLAKERCIKDSDLEGLIKIRDAIEEKILEYEKLCNEKGTGSPYTDRLIGYDHIRGMLYEHFPQLKNS